MKTLRLLFATVLLTLTLFISSFAGEWQHDSRGWKYQTTDGSYLISCWAWIDDDGDGVAKCYCFDENGYCLMNVHTPDGQLIDANGSWVVNGVVQQKVVATGTTTTDGTPNTGVSNTGTSNTTVKETSAPESTQVPTTVYWTPNGEKYHRLDSCSTLKRSKTIHSGTKSQAGNRDACKVCYK